MTEQPAGAAGGAPNEIPYLRPHPGAALFERRAVRLRALADGHAMADFLRFCAALSAAQASAAVALDIPLESVAPSAERPLREAVMGRDEWHAALRLIADELHDARMPEAARGGLARAAAMGPEALRGVATQLLSGDAGGLDLAVAPFVGAALQVEYVTLAAQLLASGVMRSERACPACGAPPVAGVVLGDDKLRYLGCSLCASQWHLPRVTCSRCRSTAGISYYSLDGGPGGVKAEVCDSCHGYLKLFYIEQRPAAEPMADDLATRALDLLVAERGYSGTGVNLFLVA